MNRIWKRVLLAAAALVLLLVATVVLLAAAIEQGHLRDGLLTYIARHTGRRFEVKGAFHAHLLSMHPSLAASDVEIGNPPWMPPGVTVDAAQLQITFHLPWFGRPLGIDRLALESATLYLRRDAKGRANWQWHDPGLHERRATPLIRSLSLPQARVYLEDERRHLKFAGTMTAGDEGGMAGAPFRLTGAGQLNGHAASFQIDGDPLAAARLDRPYHFTYSEESSGSRLTGTGSLERPFHFGVLDATFEARGEDLKDLYFLTGVSLVNTGPYRVSGKIARRHAQTLFTALHATSGESDMQGEVTVDSSAERPKLEAKLRSKLLRLADLGLRAAGRAPPDAGPHLILSQASLTPKSVRHGDAAVAFQAQQVKVGRVMLTSLAAHMTIDKGVLIVTPLTADLLQGKLAAQVKLDATTDLPRADFDLKVSGMEIAQWPRKDGKPPAMEGRLQARAKGSGRGTSVHDIGASANGTFTAVLPHGTIHTSLAELTGLDLKGLGLAMKKSPEESELRCGAASFEAKGGMLTSRTLVIDTQPMLVSGGGTVRLDTESLDLTLQGRPKAPHLLRLRSPVLVGGTLSQPSFKIEPAHAAGQAAVAVALGVLLTPLASILAFVDPGLAKDADCSALIGNAKAVSN